MSGRPWDIGYKYDGAYRVWIPKMGVREYFTRARCQPRQTKAPLSKRDESNLCDRLHHHHTTHPIDRRCHQHHHCCTHQHRSRRSYHRTRVQRRPTATIRIPGKHHPRRAPQPEPPTRHSTPQTEPEELLQGDSDEAPQYVGRVHQFPARSTRSGLVRDAGGGGALLAFRAFEDVRPTFTPVTIVMYPIL